ncbi:hypothetical protein DERF_004827 [Dermatophagoides farinae]|uniref:Uncharacterized protein n=1 Tax=Dermatophagoides farinae TaxID=6954 RepID=A0A922L5M1_DERFA|nr:hypothetical protein DERF_004827 [Dermatophagoides farinae]
MQCTSSSSSQFGSKYAYMAAMFVLSFFFTPISFSSDNDEEQKKKKSDPNTAKNIEEKGPLSF